VPCLGTFIRRKTILVFAIAFLWMKLNTCILSNHFFCHLVRAKLMTILVILSVYVSLFNSWTKLVSRLWTFSSNCLHFFVIYIKFLFNSCKCECIKPLSGVSVYEKNLFLIKKIVIWNLFTYEVNACTCIRDMWLNYTPLYVNFYLLKYYEWHKLWSGKYINNSFQERNCKQGVFSIQ